MKLHGGMVLAAALTVIIAAGPAYGICAENSGVFGTATQTGPSMWTYDFSVLNGCAPDHQQLLTDFYIPYFADAGIENITVPSPDTMTTTSTISWTAAIQPNNDLFDLVGAGVIDFQVTVSPELEVGPDQFAPGVGYYGASGFSSTSDFAPVEGPYAILQSLPPDYVTTTTLFGDPSIPGSPDTIAALDAAAAPEPGTTGLLAVGLCVTMANLNRRRRAWLSAGKDQG
jgi:hypothetical protein